MWWQQDGTPAHTSNETLRYPKGQFPGRLMSKRGDCPWPPPSLDLAVCDFFLWGHLKHQIWNVPQNQQPRNLRDLQAAIVRECMNFPQQIVRGSFDAMVSRARRCINARGRAFPDKYMTFANIFAAVT